MAAPPQQQSTPGDHHYFEWSSSKQQKLVPIGVNQQQTNLTDNHHPHLHNHPLMTHTHRRHYYQHYEEKRLLENNKLKQNTKAITSPINSSATSNNTHIRKKQKTNGIESSLNTNDDQNQSQQQTCYPFQAELTQKIDIECGGNTSGQLAHTPTHHFTLSTVINVSVNGQTPQSQKSLDILPSLPQQQLCPITSNDQQDSFMHPSSPSVLSIVSPTTNLSPSSLPSTLYSDVNQSIYLKDIDLTSLDTFVLPACPNSQDYLTIDGLLTFLMSDKSLSNQKSIECNKRYQQQLTLRQTSSQQYHDTYRMQQTYNYPPTQHYRYPSMGSSYPYSTHPQSYQMTQHYNYAQSMPQQNSSSMIMTGTCASSSSIQQPSVNPSSITTETGNIYPSSYYRQSSLPQQQQMTRQISSNYSTTTASSSSSPAPPCR